MAWMTNGSDHIFTTVMKKMLLMSLFFLGSSSAFADTPFEAAPAPGFPAQVTQGTTVEGTYHISNVINVPTYYMIYDSGLPHQAVTVDPDNFRGADSDFTLAQNEGTQCIWDGTKWFIIGNESKLTIA